MSPLPTNRLDSNNNRASPVPHHDTDKRSAGILQAARQVTRGPRRPAADRLQRRPQVLLVRPADHTPIQLTLRQVYAHTNYDFSQRERLRPSPPNRETPHPPNPICPRSRRLHAAFRHATGAPGCRGRD